LVPDARLFHVLASAVQGVAKAIADVTGAASDSSAADKRELAVALVKACAHAGTVFGKANACRDADARDNYDRLLAAGNKDIEVGVLAQIAGGGAGGSSWFHEKPQDVDILSWFESTLKVANGAQIESHCEKTKAALGKVRADEKFLQRVAPAVSIDALAAGGPLGDLPQILRGAKAAIDRAVTTKYECLIGLALLRPSSTKLRSRVEGFAAQLVEELK
ncbi:unnamed protein product, partial [Prorocentrum cordatum]